jgi:GT2 family glycosyltransferase
MNATRNQGDSITWIIEGNQLSALGKKNALSIDLDDLRQHFSCKKWLARLQSRRGTGVFCGRCPWFPAGENDMDAALTRVDDYLATLARDSEEVRFLRSVPWIAGTYRQDSAHILAALRAEASWFAEGPDGPVFSLITPLWNTPPLLLQELILSVRLQSWLRWELILVDDGSVRRDHLEVAHRWAERDPRIRYSTRAANGGISVARNEAVARSAGDFLAILDHDDLLHPLALSTFVRHLRSSPEVNLIYSNEAKINGTSDRVQLYLNKPPFDLTTLVRVNYLCHFTAVRRELLLSAAQEGEGIVFRPRFDGVEDHDLFLRIALTGRVRPLHVPLCLYYWRMIPTSTALSHETKPDIEPKRQAMLDDLLPAIYPGARCAVLGPNPERGHQYPSIRITALAEYPQPRLLVMVPFRDHLELTLRCLEALEAQEHALGVQVLLINNQSGDTTVAGMKRWLAQPRRNRFALVDHTGAFNFARIHNQAVARYAGSHDLLLFLNNDVELISSDCLQTLAMHLLATPESAFAGIRLNYPGGQGIQHGGITIHETALTCGCYPFLHSTEITDYVAEERAVFGVTFACAMVRRPVFERLGGLDEVLLPNSYGDVDIQARALELGMRNHYFGTLVGTHHESKSRGRISEELEFLALHDRHARVISHWKLRGFRLSLERWPPEPGVVPPPDPQTIPLRYKLADRINAVLKRVLGPVHTPFRAGFVRLVGRVKRTKKRPALRSGALHAPYRTDRSAFGPLSRRTKSPIMMDPHGLSEPSIVKRNQ